MSPACHYVVARVARSRRVGRPSNVRVWLIASAFGLAPACGETATTSASGRAGDQRARQSDHARRVAAGGHPGTRRLAALDSGCVCVRLADASASVCGRPRQRVTHGLLHARLPGVPPRACRAEAAGGGEREVQGDGEDRAARGTGYRRRPRFAPYRARRPPRGRDQLPGLRSADRIDRARRAVRIRGSPPVSPAGFWGELREGGRVALRNAYIRALLATTALINIGFNMAWAVLLVFAIRELVSPGSCSRLARSEACWERSPPPG
jgi:hypothetical protein